MNLPFDRMRSTYGRAGDGQLFTLSWSTRKSFEDHRTNGLDVFVA